MYVCTRSLRTTLSLPNSFTHRQLTTSPTPPPPPIMTDSIDQLLADRQHNINAACLHRNASSATSTCTCGHFQYNNIPYVLKYTTLRQQVILGSRLRIRTIQVQTPSEFLPTAIRRYTTPRPTAGQHLATHHILQNRDDTQINIGWVPGHTEGMGNETADKCAKSAAELPNRGRYAFTSLAYIKRQIRQMVLREWQSLWETTSRGQGYCSIARKQPLWGPSWKPAKLLNTDQTTGTWLFQSILSTPPKLQLHPSASARIESRVRSTSSYDAGHTRTKEKQPESLEKQLCTPSSLHRREPQCFRTSVATRGWLLK